MRGNFQVEVVPEQPLSWVVRRPEVAMDTNAAWVLSVCIIIAAVMRAPPPRSSGVGRYQFVHSNGVNCFVLDTKTGRLWQRLNPSSEGPTEWSEHKAPWAEAPARWGW